jgi:hypothetical protein
MKDMKEKFNKDRNPEKNLSGNSEMKCSKNQIKKKLS